MEEDCLCLFCQRDDLNMYEINQNSVLIGSELVDFTEIIFEIFNASPNNSIINYICEECKDLVTQFYCFKLESRHNLVRSTVYDKLKKFLLDFKDCQDPIVKCTATQFVVSYGTTEDTSIQYSIVKPIMNMKYSKSTPKETIVKVADSFPCQDEVEVEVKFNESEVDEVQEEEVYAVESIMDAEEIEDAENDFEEDDGAKTESDDLEKVEVVNEKVFQCQCGQLYPTSSELKIHMQQAHTPQSQKRKAQGTEMCCDVFFKDYKCFTIHQKAHENFDAIVQHMASFTCSDCNVMFSNDEDLEKHLEKHTDGCDLADFIVERRGAFEDHFLRNITENYYEDVEDTGDLMQCGHCKKKLPENELKVHLLFFHTTAVFCPMDNRCFEGTKHVRLFSDHIRNKHPEIFDKNLLYSCRHCSESFATCFEKLAHMKLCNSKPFPCVGHCNKRFASEWLLKNHMKTINGDDRFACEMCGKKCVSRSDLQIHERMHTNERPYPCSFCDKKFKTSANRSSHMDIHETDKKHECFVCGEKFQTRPILRKHKKMHDMKYQEECTCKICDRKYATKQHLLRHLKSSHSMSSELGSDDITKFYSDHLDGQVN